MTPHQSKPLTYLISDSKLLGPSGTFGHVELLIDFISRAVDAGIDLVQIRERNFTVREVTAAADAVVRLSALGTRILINDRADIAAACGAGTHLTTRSIPVEVVRRAFGPSMLLGASTHTIEEACTAEQGGADFVVFGPVFEPGSKKAQTAPVGTRALRDICRSLRIPVLALGGISRNNFAEALDAGAAGVAGISMFTSSPDLKELISALKAPRS